MYDLLCRCCCQIPSDPRDVAEVEYCDSIVIWASNWTPRLRTLWVPLTKQSPTRNACSVSFFSCCAEPSAITSAVCLVIQFQRVCFLLYPDICYTLAGFHCDVNVRVVRIKLWHQFAVPNYFRWWCYLNRKQPRAEYRSLRNPHVTQVT